MCTVSDILPFKSTICVIFQVGFKWNLSLVDMFSFLPGKSVRVFLCFLDHVGVQQVQRMGQGLTPSHILGPPVVPFYRFFFGVGFPY